MVGKKSRGNRESKKSDGDGGGRIWRLQCTQGGGGLRKECHGVDVNFGCDVSCVWIFSLAPQFFNSLAGTPFLARQSRHGLIFPTTIVTVSIVHIVGIVRVHIQDPKP